MKLKFKHQTYQNQAVQAIIDCFKGQPNISGLKYRIDPGKRQELYEDAGFRNADLILNEQQLLENVQAVQRRQNLPLSTTLIDFKTIKRGSFQADPAYTRIVGVK